MRFDIGTLDSGERSLPFGLLVIRSFSNLQVKRTGIISWTSSNFGQIRPLPTELGALERWKISHRLIMGKWCLQTSSFNFDRIFIKLAGNQDRHNISDEFEFRPNWISHLGVTCPWERFKFSIDLLWNLQVQLTFQMKIYFVPCGRNSSYSFSPIVLKLFRCFLHGMKMCTWFGYNSLIILFSLFLLCDLSLFSVLIAIKVYRQFTLWVQLLLQFSTYCFETLQLFSAWNEGVHVVLV